MMASRTKPSTRESSTITLIRRAAPEMSREAPAPFGAVGPTGGLDGRSVRFKEVRLLVAEDLRPDRPHDADRRVHLRRVALGELHVGGVHEVIVQGRVEGVPAVRAGRQLALHPGVIEEGALEEDDPAADA